MGPEGPRGNQQEKEAMKERLLKIAEALPNRTANEYLNFIKRLAIQLEDSSLTDQEFKPQIEAFSTHLLALKGGKDVDELRFGLPTTVEELHKLAIQLIKEPQMRMLTISKKILDEYPALASVARITTESPEDQEMLIQFLENELDRMIKIIIKEGQRHTGEDGILLPSHKRKLDRITTNLIYAKKQEEKEYQIKMIQIQMEEAKDLLQNIRNL